MTSNIGDAAKHCSELEATRDGSMEFYKGPDRDYIHGGRVCRSSGTIATSYAAHR